MLKRFIQSRGKSVKERIAFKSWCRRDRERRRLEEKWDSRADSVWNDSQKRRVPVVSLHKALHKLASFPKHQIKWLCIQRVGGLEESRVNRMDGKLQVKSLEDLSWLFWVLSQSANKKKSEENWWEWGKIEMRSESLSLTCKFMQLSLDVLIACRFKRDTHV